MSRCFASISVTSRPPIRIAPSVTSSSPAMHRNSVVLPQPEGPTRTMNSPSSIVRSTPSTARVPFGNVFTTSWSSISATALSLQSCRNDPAGELFLQDEECDDRRYREHQRTGERHGQQLDLLCLVVVPVRDLDA